MGSKVRHRSDMRLALLLVGEEFIKSAAVAKSKLCEAGGKKNGIQKIDTGRSIEWFCGQGRREQQTPLSACYVAVHSGLASSFLWLRVAEWSASPCQSVRTKGQ